MASLSSSSVSGSSSLGNTSLRGFGGLASGIDRDAIIEQMSLATNTKITNQKSAMTKLEWKQEAYRSVTDKVLDLMDKYTSYSSTTNLKDPTIFSKTLVSTKGAETSTRFVTATGTSALVDNVSITGVKQLATSTVRQSNAHISSGGLKTTLGNDFSGDVGKAFSYPSTIQGRQITVGILETDSKGKTSIGKSATFTLPATYKDDDGVEHTISYTPEKGEEPDGVFYAKLANELNEALKYSDKEISVNESTTKKLSELIEFKYDADSGEMGIVEKAGGSGGYTFAIAQNSSALKGVGVNADEPIKLSDGVSFAADKVVTKQTTIDYLTNKSLIFEYDGTQKTVSLLTSEDAAYLKDNSNFKDDAGNVLSGEALANAKLKEMKSRLQGRLDTAFGKDAIKVNVGDVDEKGNEKALTFNTSNPTSAVNILSKDDTLLKNLGLEFGASNKVNIDGKLGQDALGLNADDYTNANGQLDLKINGVSITGLTANSTVTDILSKINSTKAAGVKATYVEATGQFMLVSSETGAGRTISLDSELSKALFGGSGTNDDGNLVDAKGNVLAEKDADGNFWYGFSSEQNIKGMDASGNLVDKDGNTIATKDASGNFWKDNSGNTIHRVDATGKYLNADGKFISEDGKLVNGSGYLVDEKGRLITGEKDPDGKDQLIDKNGYRINEKGQFIDANGKAINKDGHFIDDENRLVDDKGNLVDKDGYLINEKGQFLDGVGGKAINKDGHYIDDQNRLVDEDGNLVDEDGYLIDENGHFLNGVKGEAIKKDDEDGNWYKVDKNGNYLSTKTDGGETKTISIKKDEDGNWYEVDENNKFVTDDDGNKISADGGMRQAGGVPEAVKGGNVSSSGLVQKTEGDINSKLVETAGLVDKGIGRIEGIAETIDYGKNAKIEVSYGNGIYVDLERSSNTFNLEGMTVTVSGVFGGEYQKGADGKVPVDEDGNPTSEWVRDTSQAVTFSAKADVDAAVERVKSFMEDFNAMISEINGQVTSRPDSSYGPLTDEQKDEMDETSIENWEKKAKQGILFNDDVMRDLSSSTQGILSKLMSYGVNYQDLEKIGITYSEDYTDGGTLVFDESKFRSAMESNPDLVSNIFTGGGDVKKGLMDVVEESLTPYATRYASKNGGSYGRLVEVAGTEKKPTTLLTNQIYKELKEMEENISKLREKLKVEQDRYISQFTTMESLINKMNSQSSYLSQIMA